MKVIVGTLCMIFVLGASGCRRADPATEKDLATPVVPDGFNEKALDKLSCPENGTKLRFATKKELADINDRIGAMKIKNWFSGAPRTEAVNALLIRADAKIGYRVDGIVPVLRIEEALVLKDGVGPPDAKKNRQKGK